MQEFSIFDIDADMADCFSRLKKHEIAGYEFVLRNFGAGVDLLIGAARQLYRKARVVGEKYKSRTIDAAFGEAANFVFYGAPFIVLCVKRLFDPARIRKIEPLLFGGRAGDGMIAATAAQERGEDNQAR